LAQLSFAAGRKRPATSSDRPAILFDPDDNHRPETKSSSQHGRSFAHLTNQAPTGLFVLYWRFASALRSFEPGDEGIHSTIFGMVDASAE
jgi:hypothetical protein